MRSKSFQLLVVEDFEPFRRVICSKLREKTEFKVSEASDGLEAVRKAEQLQPDVLLLDVGLPSLNGIEVCECVSKVSPISEILFLSQEDSPDIVQEALRLGALGYVHKSQTQGELLPAIDAVLRGKHFVSRALLAVSPQDQAKELIGESDTPLYPWQQKVMDAFQSPPKSMAVKIANAERAIAARLRDRIDKRELRALKRALRSLVVLIDETTPQPKVDMKNVIVA